MTGQRETQGKLPTAQDLVLREIRQAIMTRRLKPGQRIRQWDLADRLNVSSVPVREALKTLEAEGQVTYEPYRGYKVVELSVGEDRKSTRLNSSHANISYAVFCLKK